MSPFTSARVGRRGLLRLAGAAAVAGAVPLSGCGAGAPKEQGGDGNGDGGGGGDRFRVYWNAGHTYDAYRKVIDEFEQAHGVTVEWQPFQWPDLRTRLLADFASGDVPDVVEESGWVQEFAITGDALSLQTYLDADGEAMGYPSDWQDNALKRMTYQGETYGIQLHLTCTMLLYNKAMLDKAGIRPPDTWDDLLAAAKELTGGGVYGIALNQDPSYSWPWFLQNGVRPYDPERRRVLTPTDAAIEALQFQADLVHKHKVSPVPTPGTDYSGPQKLLSAGRAAMILTGPWDLEPIATSSPDLDLGIARPLRKKVRSTIQAGSGVFIPAKAKRPDLSWDFIKRITALDVELAATEEAGMLMPRKSWAKHPSVQNDEQYKAFADALGYAVDVGEEVRLTGKSGELGELFKTMYQSAVMQNTPASEAVRTYVDAATKVLDS